MVEAAGEVIDLVATVRRFNRFYFPRMAPIRDALTVNGFHPTELRVYRELGRAPMGASSAWLVHHLGIDAGQLSRILRKFREHRFIGEGRASYDGRIKHVELTRRGWEAHRRLERSANAAAAKIVAHLTPGQERRLVAAMETIEEILGNPELPRGQGR